MDSGQRVRIYGREKCPFTRQAREAYGPDALFLDVEADAQALAEMLRLGQGSRRIPLILARGQVSIGFQGRS